MKKTLGILLITYQLCAFQAQAQTLFTFGNEKVDKKEFVKFYDENNFDKDKYSRNSIDNYINMYALYKMKIKEAERLQIDTLPKVKSEIISLKKQLAKPYLVDQSIVESLMNEVKARYNTEVEVAHILISSWGNDTLQAYQEINQIYNDINKGTITFEEAAKKHSDDGYSKGQGGYLGYISALDIKYGIENAAYSTDKGQISKPIKTDMGYHIVKVINKRPAKGKIEVAQILIKPNKPSVPESVTEAQTLAEQILKELKAGANFDEYVQKYSDDLISKNDKGVITPFLPGTYELAFEKAAFNIEKNGEYAPIVQTEFGFHIIKLIKRHDKPPFEEAKSQLTQRLKLDGRLAEAEKKMKENQLKKFNFVEHTENIHTILDWASDDTAKVIDLRAKDLSAFKGNLFSIKGKTYSQKDFFDYMIDVTGGQIYGKKEESINQLYELYKNNILENVHLDELYKNNEQYRTSFDRDRNGILIFELMNQKVFQKSNEDVDALQKFYEDNKTKYTYKPGFEGYILETESEDALKKLLPLLSDYNSIREIIFDYNQQSPVKVDHINGKYEYYLMPNLKTNNIQVYKPSEIFMTPNGKYSVIIPEKTFDAGTIKPFNESRAQVANDYQMYLDEQWSKELLERYPLKVNTKVSQSIKK